MEQTRNIGIGVTPPAKSCEDDKCPFHGSLKVRGRHFVGKIISAKMRRTASFEFERRHFIPKYERYEKKRTTLKVHNPDCIDAKEGDIVKVMESRPLSKTKSFVIVEKMPAARSEVEEHAAV